MSVPVLLSVKEASVRFGKEELFQNLEMYIREGEHIALVGKNGAGKTTLMRIITGAREPDSGERWLRQGARVGYLPQDVTAPPDDMTVKEFVAEGLKKRKPKDGDAGGAVEAHEADYIAEIALTPLELLPDAKMSTLSGGQRRRAALARALAEEPDVLLLDEPTNHLDLEGIKWLENYLARYNGALLTVSHDRAFLGAVSNRVFWLDRGAIRVCPKGFSHFAEWSAELLDLEARELRNRERALELELEWATRGVKARRKRNERRKDEAFEEKEKLEKDKSLYRKATRKIGIPVIEAEETSKIIAEFYKAEKAFPLPGGGEKKVMGRFSLKVQRGDRIGLIGRNGSGKSSFLKLLNGDLEPDAGKVKRARHLEFSYFEQNREGIKPGDTVRTALLPQGGDYIEVHGKERHICGYLKDYLFDPRIIDTPVSSLSGGQKNRLLLAKTLAKPGNVLILDEPTNDLDTDTLDRLQEILRAYQGTLLLVSHDRDFLDNCVDKILAFDGSGHIGVYNGGYSDYLAAVERGDEAPDAAAKAPKPAGAAKEKTPAAKPKKASAKMSYKLEREYALLPGNIAALEKEIAELDNMLNDPELYGRDPALFDKTSARYGAAKEELDAAELRWLELDEMKNAG